MTQIYSADIHGKSTLCREVECKEKSSGKCFVKLGEADDAFHYSDTIRPFTPLLTHTANDVVIKGVTARQLLNTLENFLYIATDKSAQVLVSYHNEVSALIAELKAELSELPRANDGSLTDKNMALGLGQIAPNREGRNGSLPFDAPHIAQLSQEVKEEGGECPPCQTCNADIHTKECPYYGTSYSGVFDTPAPSESAKVEKKGAFGKGQTKANALKRRLRSEICALRAEIERLQSPLIPVSGENMNNGLLIQGNVEITLPNPEDELIWLGSIMKFLYENKRPGWGEYIKGLVEAITSQLSPMPEPLYYEEVEQFGSLLEANSKALGGVKRSPYVNVGNVLFVERGVPQKRYYFDELVNPTRVVE